VVGSYFHSVTLDKEKCKGCTNCIKRCPTEAIRVREGRAVIIEERCIDCGECVRTCPNLAKSVITDGLDAVLTDGFEKRVVMPAPSFYGQFKPDVQVPEVLGALTAIGFDGVYEVARAAEFCTYAMRQYISDHSAPRPLISAACPAIVRLIQVRFPALLKHLMLIESPMEVAARLARERMVQETGLSPAKIGCYFITPCPAKVTAVRQPVGQDISNVSGVLSMEEVYGRVLKALSSHDTSAAMESSALGIGWGQAGGEGRAVTEGHCAVDGIHNVIQVLDEVERGDLTDIEFLEAQACVGGCVGGCLAVQNPFVGRSRIQSLVIDTGRSDSDVVDWDSWVERYQAGQFSIGEVDPRPVMRLATDVKTALDLLRRVEDIEEDLPGLDCGSCGSPNCRALAEDIVRGTSYQTDCVFKLRERVHELASEVVELAEKVPPAMGHDTDSSRRSK